MSYLIMPEAALFLNMYLIQTVEVSVDEARKLSESEIVQILKHIPQTIARASNYDVPWRKILTASPLM